MNELILRTPRSATTPTPAKPGSETRALRELLDAVAAATPAPGGGTSIAWTCALAAALVQMAAAFAADAGEIGSQAASLRERAIDLGEQELHSYEPVLAALRLPPDDPARRPRLDAALSDAAEAPLALARVGSEVAEAAQAVAAAGSDHLRGDAEGALLLAEAACQAAVRLVEINLSGRDDERLREARGLARRAASRRDELLGP